MDAILSEFQRDFFAFIGFVTTLFVLLRWLLKETGKFIKFFRRWWNDTFPPGATPV